MLQDVILIAFPQFYQIFPFVVFLNLSLFYSVSSTIFSHFVKITQEIKVYQNFLKSFPVVTKFDAWIEYANCCDVPRSLLITYYRSCLLHCNNKLQVRCKAKRMAKDTVFFLPLNGFKLVTFFYVTRFLENHETTDNVENVKTKYEERLCSSVSNWIHAAYVYAIGKRKTDFSESSCFDLLLLHFFRLQQTQQWNYVPKQC